MNACRLAFLVAVGIAPAALLGCTDPAPADPTTDTATATDAAPDTATDTGAGTPPIKLKLLKYNVTVTLDGKPIEGAFVSQGGNPARWLTDADGKTQVTIDPSVPGQLAVVAAHREARTTSMLVDDEFPDMQLDMVRFDTKDNEAYVFKQPGMPGHSPSTEQCGHCHKTNVKDWYPSAHRTSVSGAAVQDLYAGVATKIATKSSCKQLGGMWRTGRKPGTNEQTERCYVGAGVLAALNPGCDSAGKSCDDADNAAKTPNHGACADCHAPGIDGKLGGRDLLDATGEAFKGGIHCEVCHHVEAVVDDAPAGVAGRLKILRPSEPGGVASVEKWAPLLFGPNVDVPNGLMGMVPREHFRESRFCAGCHELKQDVLVPGGTADSKRWPDGKLPIHTTFTEWNKALVSFTTTCQGCHMAPDMTVENSADLQFFPATVGVIGGWPRPKGTVKKHAWSGPDSGELLKAAAALSIDALKVGDKVEAKVSVSNYSGHGLPTGEPMRSVVLRVAATCDGEPAAATGGVVVPDFGGFAARKTKADDWTKWPGAAVGDVIRVVAEPGGHSDYLGSGKFGDGTFDAAAKGMPVQRLVGSARVTKVDGDKVTLDGKLPAGDVAYRVGPTGDAGGAGMAFAKVLVGPKGARMVPHFLAVDVASDNRIPSGATVTTRHVFKVGCDDPAITATLVHRDYPPALAAERGWKAQDRVIATETTSAQKSP